MEAKTIRVTKASYNDRRLNFSACGSEFFPDDAFGSPKGNGTSGRPITLRLRGLSREVRSDFPKGTSGCRRWFLRDRKWVRDFLDQHSLEAGDQINIVRHAEREYYLEPVPKTVRFIDLFAGIGGTRLAFENADASCVFSSEWNRFAQ